MKIWETLVGKKRKAETVKPISNSVALIIHNKYRSSMFTWSGPKRALTENADSMLSYYLESRLIKKGIRVIPLPTDWRAWRESQKIDRQVLLTDPELIVEIVLNDITIISEDSQRSEPQISAGVRVFKPNGWQSNTDFVYNKYANHDMAEMICRLVTKIDPNEASELLDHVSEASPDEYPLKDEPNK